MTSDRITTVVLFVSLIGGGAARASAQPTLSLADAIQRARAQNPDVASAAAAEREAAARVIQARGAYFPKVDAVESWQRGNHPAFVFSSLLAERQFAPADFSIDALNHPAAVTNFRAAVAVEQALFDRANVARVRAATVGRDLATTGKQLVRQELTSTVIEAFGRVLVATATVRSAAAAVESARADRELAGNRREAGRVTDADVLQMDVHLARTLELQVQAVSDERIARARLNQLMGEPLAAMFSLDLTDSATDIDISDADALEAEALKNRPEIAWAKQQERLAAAAENAAHAAFFPQVSVQGVWELNGDTWNSRPSAWVVGAVARINLFRGFTDSARLAETHAQATRARAERGKAETTVRLDVRVAIAALEAARASEAVGRTSVDSAHAGHRIVRDRYETGLADAATLLRSAEAVEEAEAQRIAALVDVITSIAAVQRATGRL